MKAKSKRTSICTRLLNSCDLIHEKSLMHALCEMGAVQVIYWLCIYLVSSQAEIGFWNGLLVGFSIHFAFFKILDKLGYELISGCDKMACIEVHANNNRNCGGNE